MCVCQGLELLLRGRSLELEQVQESYTNLQQQQQEHEHRHVHALEERDAVIGQLQVALQAHAQESQVRTGVTSRNPRRSNQVLILLLLLLLLTSSSSRPCETPSSLSFSHLPAAFWRS